MTILERMATCGLFTDMDANYPEEAAALAEARQKGKHLCWEINRLDPLDVETRMARMHELFGGMGKDCWMEPPIYCAYGRNVTMGDDVYLN